MERTGPFGAIFWALGDHLTLNQWLVIIDSETLMFFWPFFFYFFPSAKMGRGEKVASYFAFLFFSISMILMYRVAVRKTFHRTLKRTLKRNRKKNMWWSFNKNKQQTGEQSREERREVASTWTLCRHQRCEHRVGFCGELLFTGRVVDLALFLKPKQSILW